MTSDWVYTQVLKAALQAGASQTSARNNAQLCSERYRKGQYSGKVSKLIEDAVKQAKRDTPKNQKRGS